MMGVPKDEVDEVLQNAKADFRIAGFDEEETNYFNKKRPNIGFDGTAIYSLQCISQREFIT